MVKKKKTKDPTFARTLTAGMATWSFVISFLCGCFVWMGYTDYAPSHWTRFDNSSFIHLNLVLSLIAAIQGAVIMIYQKYQDRDRDKMMSHIEHVVMRVNRVTAKIEKFDDQYGPKIDDIHSMLEKKE